MDNRIKNINKKKSKLKVNKRKPRNTKFIDRLIQLSRVTKVTKGGKTLSFRAVVAIGNEQGVVGIGIAKANDVINAFKKAKSNGYKSLILIPLTKSFTIPHHSVGYFGACKVVMHPSLEGSGVIAGGAVRIVLEVAGIKNITAKQLGSSNLLNNARATLVALKNLTTKEKVFKNRKINF